MFKAILLIYGLKSFAALFTLLVFSAGISQFSLSAYGGMMITVSIFGLVARIVAFGFDYKIRDLVQDYDVSLADVMLLKQTLALFVVFCLVLFHHIFRGLEDLGLICAAIYVYSFDTMPYFQAKDRHERPMLFVLSSFVLGAAFLGICLLAGSLTRDEFLILSMICPSAGWVLATISELIRERIRPSIQNSKKMLQQTFQMFTVSQLGGLYVNIIPIVIGLQSEIYVAMYTIILRISNFGKTFGQVVNQVFFYKVLKRRLTLDALISISGSLVIGTGCCFIVFYFFNKDIQEVFASLGSLLFLVILFILTGSVANFLIIKVFFERRFYVQYRNLAFFLIVLPIGIFALFNVHLSFVIYLHVLIETLIICGCVSYYFMKINH